jgi:DNA mismatch endonuclease, patch repair protein
MRGNRRRDSRPEKALRSSLWRLGLRYRKNKYPLVGLRCEADVVFPREQVAVFVDGCFWHGCSEHGSRPTTNSSYWNSKIDRNCQRDAAQRNALLDAGWEVVQVWEHEAPHEAARRVREVVLARRAGVPNPSEPPS